MIKKVLILLGSTFLILFILEGISRIILKDDSKGFFMSPKFDENNENLNAMNAFGFDEVHPLLGWKMSETYIHSLGLEIESGIAVLPTEIICDNPIVIFVTGGSTTDIALHAENWPIHFKTLLDQEGQCAKIYFGAVGGYHSGQEFLQLVCQFDKELKIDIHISYSGANEFQFPNYVSRYEQAIFDNLITNKQSLFLPSTLGLIQRILNQESFNLKLSELKIEDSHLFWHKNMEKMALFADAQQYDFYGILQPVITFSGMESNFANELEEAMPYEYKGYSSFYPKAIISCQNQEYLYDMTNMFENATENVFIDDCHLHHQYQMTAAKSIYEIIDWQKFKANE